jgi:hypothetical protein
MGLIKSCLKTSVLAAGKKVSFEVLSTALVRIENTLNRRPIAFNDEGMAICPAQLLNPLSAESTHLPLEYSPMQMAQHVGKIAEKFWKEWRHIYLHELNADRVTKKGRFIPLAVGDHVLVDDKGPNVFIDKWTPAKVVEVHPSEDGHVRVVTVETPTGRVRRGIDRLAVVETQVLHQKEKTSSPAHQMPSGGVSVQSKAPCFRGEPPREKRGAEHDHPAMSPRVASPRKQEEGKEKKEEKEVGPQQDQAPMQDQEKESNSQGQ